jgi:hypothetical protein
MNNGNYEFILPYDEIHALTETKTEEKITLDEALSSLKKSGLDTVSVEPDTLSRWEDQNIITIFSQNKMEELLSFSDQKNNALKEEEGLYITIPEDTYFDNKIKKHFNPEEITVSNQAFYFVPGKAGENEFTPIGYNEQALDKITQNGLNYILRIENTTFDANKNLINEVIQLKNEHFSNVLFSGEDVIGYPNIKELKRWANQLDQAGFGFYTIEFANQNGIQTISRLTDFNIIRLHSLDLKISDTFQEKVDRVVRAVKERNIRAVFLHLDNGTPAESLENTTQYLTDVNKEMPTLFESGSPDSFDKINSPLWMKAVVLLSGILFTYLAASSIFNNKIGLVSVIASGLLFVAYMITSNLLVLQIFALMIAVTAPIYSVVSTKENTTKISSISIQYLRAAGISAIGIAIVVGLLNGNEFITGIEMFRGVKLVYIVPLLFVTIYAFWGQIINILKSQVKYWHIVILLFVAFAGFYYITRTGNAGSVSELELLIRQKLEEILYVRPRTKEFLIGFPFYLLALYVMGINKKWGKFLLIPGVIGFLSIVNTFTHLHIPLYISVLRTFYSLVLGFAIGMLFIYLFKICYRHIHKVVRARWS